MGFSITPRHSNDTLSEGGFIFSLLQGRDLWKADASKSPPCWKKNCKSQGLFPKLSYSDQCSRSCRHLTIWEMLFWSQCQVKFLWATCLFCLVDAGNPLVDWRFPFLVWPIQWPAQWPTSSIGTGLYSLYFSIITLLYPFYFTFHWVPIFSPTLHSFVLFNAFWRLLLLTSHSFLLVYFSSCQHKFRRSFIKGLWQTLKYLYSWKFLYFALTNESLRLEFWTHNYFLPSTWKVLHPYHPASITTPELDKLPNFSQSPNL